MEEKLRAELDDQAEIAAQMSAWRRNNPSPQGTVGDVADHIEHIIEVAGIDHVGIGSDFYDEGGPSMAAGIDDCSKYPNLFAELLKRGHGEDALVKIAGQNLLRAMREMERVARELQKDLRDQSAGNGKP
jgi:membrane dipeptidase